MAACAFLLAISPLRGAEAGEGNLEKLQGSWAIKKVNPEGQTYNQKLEIRRDKLTFQRSDGEGRLVFFAKGTMKLEKLGPFNVLKLSEIESGRSADETSAVDDVRTSIYVVGEGTLTLASNLDKQRENQQPTLDTYTRAAGATASGGVGAEEQLVGKWKMELTQGDNTRDYELRIAKGKEGLEGVLVSPRSGEHKTKSVSLKGSDFLMEVNRDIEGNEVVFIYKGKLSDGKLSGTVVAKGFEDQFTGQWKAQK